MAKETAVKRAVNGIHKCAGPDGWASMWPGDVTDKALSMAVEGGLLVKSTRPLPGAAGINMTVYRLTIEGIATLPTEEVPR